KNENISKNECRVRNCSIFFKKKNVREIDAAVKRNLLNKQLK
mgnify:CR=1